MTFSITLGLAVTFENYQNFTCLHIFFDLKQFNRNKLWYPLKWVSFTLFNYSSLSYIVLALSSVLTDLPDKTSIFHDLQGPKIKFHDFPGLENEILKFHNFPGFPWPARTQPSLQREGEIETVSWWVEENPGNQVASQGSSGKDIDIEPELVLVIYDSIQKQA